MTVTRYIEAVVRTHGTRAAVRDANEALSYDELWHRSGEVADRLRAIGVASGDLVGLCLERSVALVVDALAIMRTGAAYVAIDPAYPEDRIAWMRQDSGVVAMITEPGHPERVEGAPASATGSQDGQPAYVVYTSGSTGRPKGVLVDHDSLINLVDWHRTAFALTPEDRCTQISSPGFDAAMWETWPALAAGASLHVVPEPLRVDPAGLRDWLVTERITVSFLPTALAESVLTLRWPADAPLRYLLTGGDALTRRPAPDFPATVVNNYGLSETTVVATSGVVSAGGEGTPTIGRAIAGVTLEVLDEHLAPVTAGTAGELVIGGPAVARGYLGRTELTAERFLQDDGRRRYRTGDRVRIDPDGEVVFLGRLDDQLSVRGFRVEPGEIVAALCAHPAIATAVITTAGETSAERRLVAYLVASGQQQPGDEELSAHVGTSLPAYMVPARYVWLAEVPVTTHGKVDREALARFAHPEETLAQVSLTAPPPADAINDDGPVTERAVAAIICELLGVTDVTPQENFFLLGGHSMLGAQLIARLEDRFGVELGLRFLFDHPTSGEIAGEVDAQLAETTTEGAAA